jgi:putative transposase
MADKKTDKPKPFWNAAAAAIGKRTWIPERMRCQLADPSTWNKALTNLGTECWFTVQLHHQVPATPASVTVVDHRSGTSTTSSTVTRNAKRKREHAVSVSSSTTKKKKKKDPDRLQRVHAVRVFPTPEQRQSLTKWMGCARWTYNQCLEAIESGQCQRDATELRHHCINNDSIMLQDNENLKWVFETPLEVRTNAMRDLLKNYISNFAAVKAGVRKSFDMKFKKRGDPQSIEILKKCWNPNRRDSLYWGICDAYRLRSRELLPEELEQDCRIMMDKRRRFYVLVPFNIRKESKQIAPVDRTNDQLHNRIALDPGVRSFLTGFDPSGKVIEWGVNKDKKKLFELCLKLDKLQSRCSSKAMCHRQRWHLKRRAKNIRAKMRDMVDDLHKKASKWLCSNYHEIILPKFETKKMTSNLARKINNETARAMYTWSHFRFRQRLLNKAEECAGCKVHISTEEYTTVTCGRCGNMRDSFKDKTFTCPNCNYVSDRDHNAARNILLLFDSKRR